MSHDHGSTTMDMDMDMDHGSMSMYMYFHASLQNIILFENWVTSTWAQLFGSCIAIAVLSLLYEGLKVLRDYLDRVHSARIGSASGIQSCECNVTDQTSTKTGASESTIINVGMTSPRTDTNPRHPILTGNHFLQTFLHFVQLWVGLILMLVFMTFNIYLCLAVTLGGAIGYYLFGWMKSKPGAYTPDACH